jgi:transposase InsO family protein
VEETEERIPSEQLEQSAN